MVLTGPDCPCNAPYWQQLTWMPPEKRLGANWCTSWPLSVRSGQSGPSWAITKPLWCCADQFRSVRKRLVCVGTTFCFANISALWIRTAMALYSWFIYGSQFSEEKMVWKSISQLLKYVTNNQIKKLYIFYGTPFIKPSLIKLFNSNFLCQTVQTSEGVVGGGAFWATIGWVFYGFPKPYGIFLHLSV